MSGVRRRFTTRFVPSTAMTRAGLALASAAALAAVGVMTGTATAATRVSNGDVSYGGPMSPAVHQTANPALPTRMRAWLVPHAHGTYTVYAQLTTSGTGIPGQAIGFIAGGAIGPGMCKAATNMRGIASCYLDYSETQVLLRYWGAFTARYGGAPNWQAATAHYPGILWF